MKYLPDTNIWIHYLNPPASPVKQKILSLSVSDILFCSVVKSELYFGAYNSDRKEANLALLAELFSQFKSLSLLLYQKKCLGEGAKLCFVHILHERTG